MEGFKLYFEDGTSFEGKSIPKSDWRIAPEKKIIKMEYTMGNQTKVLEGYKQYNHLVENCAVLGAGVAIRAVLLMGRTEGQTTIITFDIQHKKVFIEHKEYGEEYGKQILAGWKDGILKEPSYY